MSEPARVPETTHLQHSSAPLVETSINRLSTIQVQTRKRHREPETAGGNAFEPFQIRPYPPSLIFKPITGWPHQLLHRAQLPLSLLELNQSWTLFGSSRFFSAHIAWLENFHDANKTEVLRPALLIAKLDTNGLFHAIERVDHNIYSICRLGRWVGDETLQALASTSQSIYNRKLPKVDLETAVKGWWTSAIVATRHQKNLGRGCDTGEDAQATLAATLSPPSIEPPQLGYLVDHESQTAGIFSNLNVDLQRDHMLEAKPSSQTIFGQVVSQYLDALYMSKTSLAYFAKGPLSRARAAFLPSSEATGTIHELPNFLRSIILAPSTLDKKYKESVPSAAKLAIKAADLQDDTTQDGTRQIAKRRKSRKLKPGKEGLFPNEGSWISRWWHSDVESALALSADATGGDFKIRIAYVRFRETLLQLILHLEILALEQAYMPQHLSGTGVLTGERGSDLQGDQSMSKNRKIKKPRDLHASLETLIDWLTIWQSVDSVEQSIGENHKSDPSPPDVSEDVTAKDESGDQLRNFYTEVVIPFYGSRLPQLIEKLAHKLGISTPRSPLRRKISSSTRKTPAIPPGAEIPRNRSITRRRSSQGVSTNKAKTSSNHLPSLMRSATDSLLQEVKREHGATPQSGFSLQNGKRSLSRSSSISQAKSLSQREVDLSAIAKFNEAKSKKKASAEQELQDAIAALKKPNRALAVKDLVDAADARKLAMGGKMHKPPNLPRQRHGQSVHVNATPKRQSISQESIAATPRRAVVQNVAPDQITSSSDPCIPASTIRPTSKTAFLPGGGIAPPIWKPLPPVSETPPRNSGRHSYTLLEARMGGSRDSFEHRMAGSKTASQAGHQSTSKVPSAWMVQAVGEDTTALVAATPSKTTRKASSLETTSKTSSAMQERDPSIYDGLGWNDEDDDGL